MGHFGLNTVRVFHKMHLEQGLLMRGINDAGARCPPFTLIASDSRGVEGQELQSHARLFDSVSVKRVNKSRRLHKPASTYR